MQILQNGAVVESRLAPPAGVRRISRAAHLPPAPQPDFMVWVCRSADAWLRRLMLDFVLARSLPDASSHGILAALWIPAFKIF